MSKAHELKDFNQCLQGAIATIEVFGSIRDINAEIRRTWANLKI